MLLRDLTDQLRFRISFILIGLFHDATIFKFLDNLRGVSPLPLIELATKIIDGGEARNLLDQKLEPLLLFTSAKRFDDDLKKKLRFLSNREKREIFGYVSLVQMNQTDQLRFLDEGSSYNLNLKDFRLRRTIVFEGGSFTNPGIGARNLVYLDSVKRVIDSIYLPRHQLMIAKTNQKSTYTSKRLLDFVTSNPVTFQESWSTPKPRINSQVIHRPRPFHNIEQELRGFKRTTTLFRHKPGLLVHEKASFFEHSLYEKIGDGEICTTEKLKEAAVSSTLYSYSLPVEKKGQRDISFWDFLRGHCLQHASALVPSIEDKNSLFLSITSGEKRNVTNEIELLSEIVIWAKMRWPDTAFFVFDGWTSTSTQKGDDAVIREQNMIMSEIVKRTEISKSDYINLIGTSVEPKVRAAFDCVAFVSSGTPSIWPSKIAGIPGVIHGSKEFIRYLADKNLGGSQQTKVIEPAYVTNHCTLTKRGQKETDWARQNYSVSVPETIKMLEDILV